MRHLKITYQDMLTHKASVSSEKELINCLLNSNLSSAKSIAVEQDPLTTEEQYAYQISQAMHGNPVMVSQALYGKLPPAYQRICKVVVPMPQMPVGVPPPYTDSPHY